MTQCNIIVVQKVLVIATKVSISQCTSINHFRILCVSNFIQFIEGRHLLQMKVGGLVACSEKKIGASFCRKTHLVTHVAGFNACSFLEISNTAAMLCSVEPSVRLI